MMGPGCSTIRFRRVRRQPLPGELVAGLVLFEIQLQPGQPLGLDAQHHHRLRLAQRGLEVALDLDARPGRAASSGSSSFGPQSSTRAPSRGSSSMLERATRLCRMSPTMVTVTPASVSGPSTHAQLHTRPQMRQDRAQVEQRLRGMLVHAVAGVEHRQARLSSSSQAAPDELWRRMMASAPSARSVRPVSFSDSPFSMLELRLETSVVSAPSALGGQLKAGAGARGRLVEEQRDARRLARMRSRTSGSSFSSSWRGRAGG
jgi:hypothetical protein